MNNIFASIFFVLAAYLVGSVPFGLIITRKVKGVDIREHGSRNIGATNVFRVVGKKWGVTVLLLDALKGYAACVLPAFFGQNLSVPFQLLLGVSAILGHSFPVWLRFRGGKGVATSLGVFLAIAWIPTIVAFGLWGIVLAVTHIISISSLAAAVIFPLMIIWCYVGTSTLKFLLPISMFLAVFIFYTHRANIQRLRQGTEKKLF